MPGPLPCRSRGFSIAATVSIASLTRQRTWSVILRFFLGDDAAQSVRAKSFVQRLELGKDEALITDIVFAEVVWVLGKVYEVPRTEIAERFSKLINYRGVKMVFGKDLYEESLRLYAKHAADIQDILLAALARQKDRTVITFDRTDYTKLHCKYREP
jgi:predicted nucleic-acid-binding protein